MNTGDKCIVCYDFDDPTQFKEGTFVRDDGMFKHFKLPSNDKQIFNTMKVFPIEAKEDILAAITERRKLREAYDDSMKLIYEVQNKIARGEYK